MLDSSAPSRRRHGSWASVRINKSRISLQAAMDSVMAVDLSTTTPVLTAAARAANDDELSELMPKITQATAHSTATMNNPTPTVVPAPNKQFFGVLGQRHVICITGLPNNGKKFVAKELGWYLEFFYGTKVAFFQVEDYIHHGSREANARALFDGVQGFLHKTGGIMRSSNSGEGEADSFTRRRKENTDSGRVAIVLPPRMATLTTMDNDEARKTWDNTWSCTNAMDRTWIRKQLLETGEDYKLMFVEIEISDPTLLRQHDAALTPTQKAKLEGLREWYECSYTPLGRSASSEASLSFLKYRNCTVA